MTKIASKLFPHRKCLQQAVVLIQKCQVQMTLSTAFSFLMTTTFLRSFHYLHNNNTVLIPKIRNKAVIYYICQIFSTNFTFWYFFIFFWYACILRMHILLCIWENVRPHYVPHIFPLDTGYKLELYEAIECLKYVQLVSCPQKITNNLIRHYEGLFQFFTRSSYCFLRHFKLVWKEYWT